MDKLLREQPGSDSDLAWVVQQLRAGRRTPTPAGALAQVLTGQLPLTALHGYQAPPATSQPRLRQGRRLIAVTLLAAGALLTGGAAANALPDPAQRATATFFNTVTPFRFPLPRPHSEPAGHDSNAPSGPPVTPASSAAQPAPTTDQREPGDVRSTPGTRDSGDDPTAAPERGDDQPVSTSTPPAPAGEDQDPTVSTSTTTRPAPSPSEPPDDSTDTSSGGDAEGGSSP